MICRGRTREPCTGPTDIGRVDAAECMKRGLFAVALAEFFEPCAADRLVIAAGGAAERGRTVEIDKTMVGDGPELPGTPDAGAIDPGDLQECAVCPRHSLDADYVELSDVTHEDERSPWVCMAAHHAALPLAWHEARAIQC